MIRPPRRALTLLRWFCREDYIEEIEGDLTEVFEKEYEVSQRKAKWKFAWSVIRYLRPEFMKSFRNSYQPHYGMYKSYFKIAWRNLLRQKMLSLIKIGGFAVGVVVCIVIGVWLQRELSYDNFHPDGDRIFRIANTFKSESESFSQAPSGPALGAQLPKLLSSVKSACRVFGQEVKVDANEEQFIESNVILADSNFFSFFGFHLKKGDPQKVLGSPHQIVLTEKLAVKYFGNTENAIGKNLILHDEFPVTVSGVAENPPINSHIQFDLVVPVSLLRTAQLEQTGFDIDNLWVGGWPYVYVQLINTENFKDAEKQINEIAAKFSEKEWKDNKMSYYYFLQPLRDIHLKSHLRYDSPNNGSLSRVKIFSIIGVIVLSLACINYINLTTATAIRRAKETSVRKVVGATKAQLVRQLFVETFLSCTIAVVLAFLVFAAILNPLSAWMGQQYYFGFSATNISMILCFILAVSVIAGFYPAAMISSINPSIALKGSFLQSAKGAIIRKGLVVIQFTITIGLIASLLVITRQMNFIKNKSLGFEGNAILEVRFFGNPEVISKYSFLRNELLSSPYILNVSKHSQNVVGGLGNGWTTTENLAGEEISTSLYNMNVDTSYFKTYNMQLVAGRFFSKDIPSDTIKAVLVNETAVKTFGWQKPENAIGKPFGKGDQAQYVVGVIKDFNFESLHKPVEALRIGYSTGGNRLSLKVDATHIDEAINHLKKTWASSIIETPLFYSFVDESIARQYGEEQKMQVIFYFFTALSLLIACLGLFGLSIFIVERKIKEIGIRKVLGARVSGIVGLLSGDFLKLVLISAFIASPLAWYFMSQWLQDFAYRIDIGWWVFVVAAVISLLIAFVTVSFQAIKAAVANPVNSLRSE